MTSIERSFTVTPTPGVVIDYLKDFGNAEKWDPGTQKCTRIGAGVVTVGASWHNESRIMGVSTELTYVLEELSAERIVFVGKNDTATSVDTMSVRAVAGGTEVTYHVDLTMHGAAKLATPVMKLVFEKIGNDTVKQMTAVLNRL